MNKNEDEDEEFGLEVWLGMYDDIFHFEIFKNFMEILKHLKTPSLK